jgi:hypothetical protein
LITGLGSPLANLIVPALAGSTLSASSVSGQEITSNAATGTGSGAAGQSTDRAAAGAAITTSVGATAAT